jgi:hypothetical protein
VVVRAAAWATHGQSGAVARGDHRSSRRWRSREGGEDQVQCRSREREERIGAGKKARWRKR